MVKRKTAKRKTTKRKTASKVKRHDPIRYCPYCGKKHTKSKHKHHGYGSFARVHR